MKETYQVDAVGDDSCTYAKSRKTNQHEGALVLQLVNHPDCHNYEKSEQQSNVIPRVNGPNKMHSEERFTRRFETTFRLQEVQ